MCISSGPLQHVVVLLWTVLECTHYLCSACEGVLITLYLHARLWWLSQWRYKSVLLGFLYTLVVRAPSGWGVISVSRSGMEPCGLVSSSVNIIEGYIEIMWCKNSSICDCCCMTKVSSTYLFHILGGFTDDFVLKWLDI